MYIKHFLIKTTKVSQMMMHQDGLIFQGNSHHYPSQFFLYWSISCILNLLSSLLIIYRPFSQPNQPELDLIQGSGGEEGDRGEISSFLQYQYWKDGDSSGWYTERAAAAAEAT